jgi:hypothetical protein
MDIDRISTGLQNRGPLQIGVKQQTADFQAMLDQFQKEIIKTPEERAKDAILKKHGLSEQDYERLPKNVRQSVDREIANAVRFVEEQRRARREAGTGGPV